MSSIYAIVDNILQKVPEPYEKNDLLWRNDFKSKNLKILQDGFLREKLELLASIVSNRLFLLFQEVFAKVAPLLSQAFQSLEKAHEAELNHEKVEEVLRNYEVISLETKIKKILSVNSSEEIDACERSYSKINQLFNTVFSLLEKAQEEKRRNNIQVATIYSEKVSSLQDQIEQLLLQTGHELPGSIQVRKPSIVDGCLIS